MKKIVLLFVALISAIAVDAQHLKFKGIPIDGTITEFTTKLMAKGIQISPLNKQNADKDHIIFEGTFFGEKSMIDVYFNPKNKVVNRVMVAIFNQNKDLLQTLQEQIEDVIKEKYISDFNTFQGKRKVSNMYFIKNKEDDEDYIGSIGLDIDIMDNTDIYSLLITYLDQINFNELRKSLNEDI